MPTIVPTAPSATALQRALTETTLTGTADTFVYTRGNGDWLTLRNPTAGAIASCVITGSTAGLNAVPGVKPVDASTGFNITSIAVGATKIVFLDDIGNYLSGTITITGGAGLVAGILQGR